MSRRPAPPRDDVSGRGRRAARRARSRAPSPAPPPAASRAAPPHVAPAEPPAPGEGWRHHAAALAVLGLAIGAAFATALSAGFPLDNQVIVLGNPHLRAATWANVGALLSHDYWYPAAVNGLYRPVASLSYLFNYAVLGNADRAAGYVAVNLALHGACAALVYALVLLAGQRVRAALLAALLFALHPIATEAVANVVGRADLLAALGVLAGLACYVRAVRAGHGQGQGAGADDEHRGARSGARGSWPWQAGFALAAIAGVFAKENAVVLAPLVILWELVLERDAGWQGRLRRAAPFLAFLALLLVALLAARFWVRGNDWPAEASPLDNPILAAGFWSGLATAIEVMGLQIATLLWPLRLSADYSAEQIPLVGWPPAPLALAAMLLVAAYAAGALAALRRAPAIAFFALFYLVALLPTANLLVAIGSIMADRFLYLPLAGFAPALVLAFVRAAGAAAAAGAGADAAPRGRALATAALALVAVLLGWRTALRSLDWQSDATLWSSALRAAPRSAKAHRAYAETLMRADPERGDVDAAIASARRALAIRADYLQAAIDLGAYGVVKGDRLAAAGDGDAARAWYRRAAAVLQGAAPLERRANQAFRERVLARGDAPETIPDYGNVRLWWTLALARARLGRLEGAVAAIDRARHLDPWAGDLWLERARLLVDLGRDDEAAATLFAILELQPRNAAAAERLAALYRRSDASGEALVVESPGRASIQLDAPVVRRHRCQAFRELERVFARARLPDVAARAQRSAAEICPAPAAS